MACPFEVLDRAGCIAASRRSPAVKEKFAGGLRLPQDETGDCHMFTQALARRPKARRALHVQYRHRRLTRTATRITGVATSAGMLQADAYVARARKLVARLLRRSASRCRSIR
jgi:D-amino-acid dehydrogenase